MSRAQYFSSAAAFALLTGISLGALPALADVTVLATITKTKDINVTEDITKTKNITIDVELDIDVERGAETIVIVNQRNDENTVNSAADQTASLTDSVQENTGATNVNNAAGYFNQQGNVLSASLDQNADEEASSFAEVQTSAQQITTGNTGTAVDGNNTATMSGSVNGNSGVTQVSNAAGVSNTQLNATGIALAFAGTGTDDEAGETFVLNESDLGQELTGNSITSATAINIASISGSINGNTGITNVNNAAGAFNQQANIVTVAASTAAALANF